MILVLDKAGLQSLNAVLDYVLEHELDDYEDHQLREVPDEILRNHVYFHASLVAAAVDGQMEGER